MPDDGNKLRLLVLDDDQEVGFTLCEIARRCGFATLATSEPAQFFSSLADWDPTHIIVDLVMPKIDGIDVIKRLSQSSNLGEVIITSGLGTRVLEAAARTAKEHGLHVGGILPKPFSTLKLKQLLETPLDRMQAPALEQSDEHKQIIINEQTIAQALNREQFCVYFQPKVSCVNGALVGFESLVRWQHPQGLIMPDQFIPLVEHSGQIIPLTQQVVSQSMQWFAAQFRASSFKISINISARSLSDSGFPDWILRQCETYDLLPSQVVLEMTETTSLQDPAISLEMLTQFRIKGFNLAIDDFGVGYSSLVQLARFPFSEMKIDKIFVLSAHQSGESQKIAAAIVGLGKALGIRVTAEGVEDRWTLDFLREIGCDYAQGYFFSPPLAGDKIQSWLHKHESSPF